MRFDRTARRAVRSARATAVARGVASAGTEHLVGAMVDGDDGTLRRLVGKTLTGDALRAAFDRAARRGNVSDADVELLGGLGIDVDAVVERVERDFGERALDFPVGVRGPAVTADLGRVLRRSVDEARDLGSRRVGVEHLLLATLAAPGVAADVLNGLGASYLAVRSRLAAGGA